MFLKIHINTLKTLFKIVRAISLNIIVSGESGSEFNNDNGSCIDKKAWCMLADCNLSNVIENCPKSCGNC